MTPRLNEFPILDPEGDVLIPAQYAYSKRWGVIPASSLKGQGTGGGGDVVTGTTPIRVDRAGRVARISHEPPTLPDPERFNRYGNADEWGHIVEDYHPHGGRADHDFAAQEIAGRELSLTGPIGHPEYVPGVLGSAWGGTPEGDFWFRTIGARDSITTTELIYNRQSIEGNIKYFTDGISIDRVSDTARLVDNAGRPLRTQHDVQLVTSIGPGMYHIVQKSYDGDDRVPFRTDDLLVGYFRHDGVLPTATYLRVVSVFGPGEAVFIALQPLLEHVEDAEIHITEEERTAWNKKADASAVAGALAETLQAAKEYADEQARNLADSFAAALETAVSELKEEIRNTVATLIDNAPEALDTLQELSAALGDNPNFATEVATELGKRVTKEALAEELAKYVPKTGDTTIAGTLTATDFRIPESE